MKPDFPLVLIGTSLGEGSDRVVSNGVRIARAAGARIHLVHAYDLTILYSTTAAGGGICLPDTFAAARASRRQLLAEQAARLGIGDHELALASAVEGVPHRVLVEAAAASGASLIVIGAAERWSGVNRLLGSTADRVVRAASCPVLALRGDLALPPRRALFAVDLSPASGEAMSRGLATLAAMGAGAGEAAAIRAVYVAPEARSGTRLAAGERTLTLEAALARFVAAHLPGAGWNIERQVRCNASPGREILAASAEMAPDLLVLGTHGGGGFNRFLTGSVAESVLRQSDTSVLIVPPREASGGARENLAHTAA